MNCKYCKKEYKGSYPKSNCEKHELYCLENCNRLKYECHLCNRQFDKSKSLNGHKKHCGKVKVKIIKNKEKPLNYKCKYCDYITTIPNQIGSHTSNCQLNPDYERIRESRVRSGKIGIKPSEETKKKISISRIKYLKDNPSKVPYLLNHSSNESYPEKYFNEIFINEGIQVVRYFRFGLYELDFAILDKKIDIEIDGSQHYYDKKIIESDIRRNKLLEDDGWTILRINWSEYQKQTYVEKENYIKELKSYINDLSNIKPTISISNITKGKNLCQCGYEKCKDSIKCISCFNKGRRITDRPIHIQLKQEIEEFGYAATGRKYNVSDNTIRKWMKQYEK